MHIATLVHLTDLHLFVDERGVARDVKTQRWSRRLQELVRGGRSQDERHAITKLFSTVPFAGHGLDSADDTLWLALIATLADIIRKEKVPVAVVQTGDVEAFGSGWDGQVLYPGFAALRSVKDQLMRPEDEWFDTYGNHDTWFGAPPVPGMTAPQHIRNSLTNISRIPGLGAPWLQMWPPLASAHPTCSLQFVRINTVIPRGARAFLAQGRVLRHPPPSRPTDADTQAAIDDLRQNGHPEVRDTVRIAMLHHPVHNFSPGLMKRFSTGALAGRRELADVLSELGVSLVLAGHRHDIDPAQSATNTAQPPLHHDTLQLVADSPTLVHGERSFSLYRLYVDNPPTKVIVKRWLARHEGISERFTLDPDEEEPDISRELPLLPEDPAFSERTKGGPR
jgi:Calcineurin-like phosphoesterase